MPQQHQVTADSATQVTAPFTLVSPAAAGVWRPTGTHHRNAAGIPSRHADAVRAALCCHRRAFPSLAVPYDMSHMFHAAEERAVLRRVATLVARGTSPTTLFGAVTSASGGVLRAETTALVRFERDRTAAVVGTWEKAGSGGVALPLASRWPTGEGSIAGQVRRTGASAWVTDYESETGPEPEWAHAHGIRSAVASPIVVTDQLWGALIAFSSVPAADPLDAEEHLLAFSELVAAAIANADRNAQLAASRARVIAAADETRRRIEHDLHAVQQRLISLALEVRVAESRLPPAERSHVEQWSRIAHGLTDLTEELREIARGVHPAILDRGGLAPAVRAVIRRAGVPVKLGMRVPEQLPQNVKIAAYYVVSEAVANAVKHARASVIEVDLDVLGGGLRLAVRDDGAGGADAGRGSGLTGLSDRVEAAGGRMEVASPADGGTTVLVTIPLPSS
jgi:signal transduction histidine kinase